MTAQEKQIKELIENGTKEDIHLGLTLLDVFQLEKNEFLNKYYHAIFLFLYTEFHDKYKSFADLSSEELIEELHYFFGTTELDLDYSDFPTLPEILPLLHKLKELYLCKVTINEQVIDHLLFSEIHQKSLDKLISLEISQSLHKSLPENIHLLKNLREGLFYQNTLKYISDDFWKLSELELIDFSHNHLDKIPIEISSLKKLTRVNFSHNKIAKIPSEIKYCEELIGIEMRSNQLEELPTELFSLPKLQWLYLDNNYLTNIPIEIQQLKNLRWLHLTGNPISETELIKLKILLPDCSIVF